MRSKLIFGAAPVFLFAFLAAFFASSVFAPSSKSDATNLVSANVSYEGFYVKMNTSDVPMDLLTTATGAMTVVESTVKAATNSPAGYELYVGMSPFDTTGTEKSTPNKQKNGLYLDGDLSITDNTKVFAPASGTGGTEGSLAALTDNTWGYAVDKDTTGAPTIWANENHTTMTSATPTNDKFAAVPPVGSEDLVQATTSANVEIDTPESSVQETDYTTANLYYGIRGTMARLAGAYSNTVAYTAVAKTPPVAHDITFDPASYTHVGGTPWTDTLTITTQLYTEASNLGNATVTFSGGNDNVVNLPCGNPTVSTVDNILRVTCTLPQAAPGNYDVQIFLDKFDQTFTGTYTYNAETFNVTANAGTGITSTTGTGPHAQGSIVSLSATPDTGYYFNDSWTVDSGGVVVTNNQFVMPGNDVVVTANASLNSCPVNYDSNAPTGTTATGSTASSTMQYGSDAALTNNGYTVTGYAFQGWAETADGNVVFPDGGPISGTTYCTTNNTPKTLYAKWVKQFTYTLNLNFNDGTAEKQILNYPATDGTADTSHTFTNLNNVTPIRSGYDFKGWSSTPSGTTSLSPDSYTLNSSDAFATPTSAGFPVTGNLYAIWETSPEPPTPTPSKTIADATYFQEVTDCPSTLVEGQEYSLIDQGEPSKSYNAARLADGKCWMTSNYNLSSAAGTLSSTYYNVPSTSTFQLRASSTSWSSSATGNYVYNRTGTYGGLYSFYAATAGTNPSDGSSHYDICPKGWRLATIDDYDTIKYRYGYTGEELVASDIKLQYGGACYSGDCPFYVGSYGYYWTPRARNSSQAKALKIYSSDVDEESYNKATGHSIRCVFGGSSEPVEYTYSLNLNSNDGTTSKQTSEYPTTGGTEDTSHTFAELNLLAPTREGYQFKGWADSPSGTTPINPDSYTLDSSSASGTPTEEGTYPVTGNLYAIWEVEDPSIKKYTYTLNLNSNDGTSDKQILNFPTAGGTTNTSHTFTSLNELVPTRSGYVFKGWSTSQSGTTPLDPDSYTLDSSSASLTPISEGYPVTGNLYAIWEQAGPKTIATAEYMQEVEVCPDTLVEGQEYSLIDQGEPSKSYNAARLADGKCWMTSDYNLSSAAGTLSSTYYNVPSDSTFALPTSSDAWVNENTNQVYNRSGTYGALYTWYSATAGTNPDSGDSTYDICPKGWRLPTPAEYQTIINNYSFNISSYAKLKYSGYCYSGNCPSFVYNGMYYWSSTAYSSSKAYRLVFVSSSSNPKVDNFSKFHGLSVRCVFGS